MKITFKNIILYLLGLTLMSLGVTLMIRTLFGMGAWDAVITNLSTIANIKLGFASLIINIILLSIVMIYKKSFKYVLVIIPIAINTVLLLFWNDFVFLNVTFNEIWLKIIMFIVSLILLPLGLSLIIISTLPKMIYDELTFILMEIFKTRKFGIVRLGFEIFACLIAMLLGLIGGNVFMQIGVGTVIVTFTLGSLIDFFLKTFKFPVK